MQRVTAIHGAVGAMATVLLTLALAQGCAHAQAAPADGPRPKNPSGPADTSGLNAHLSPTPTPTPEQADASSVLFTNVNVWDGAADTLQQGMSVLIVKNRISRVAKEISVKPEVKVIDGGGRTLLPGLIDMHAHLSIHEGMLDGRDAYDQMAMGALTQEAMRDYLQQGFTTVRDTGGNVLGIAKAVHRGRIPGPRIYPSGGFLSQTGGHADTGSFNDLPGRMDDLERHGLGYIVDGRAEVLRAARQNLRAGATQIKIMAGGGVASEFDPIHMTQFTLDEMKAAVEVARDYGTYVLAHAYHDDSVNRAMDAGVRVIEHNFLVSEPTIKRMKKLGVALSLQAVMSLEVFANPEKITFFSAEQKAKAAKVYQGAKQMITWARKHKLIIVTGGDMFGKAYGVRQADNLRILSSVGFTPAEVLRTATSSAARVLSWSGGMNPYKEAELGVLKEGAYADVVLVDGNPLESLDMLSRDHVRVVLKDGVVHKNTL